MSRLYRYLSVPLLAGAILAPTPASAQVAVQGETIYSMAGPVIRDGVVLIGKDGKIERVGPASQVRIPAGYRTLTAKVVTPGLIDARTVVGMAGYLNQAHDQDQQPQACQPGRALPDSSGDEQ